MAEIVCQVVEGLRVFSLLRNATSQIGGFHSHNRSPRPPEKALTMGSGHWAWCGMLKPSTFLEEYPWYSFCNVEMHRMHQVPAKTPFLTKQLCLGSWMLMVVSTCFKLRILHPPITNQS